MSSNWIELHTPKKIEDFEIEINDINRIRDWIKEIPNNNKKVLFIYGTTGIGKTSLANTILKQFNYNKMELNAADIKHQKKMEDFLSKTLSYRNVIDMFHNGNSPIGILLDEIDLIYKLTDKTSFHNFIINIKENFQNKKKKSSSFLKIKNPIICTCNLMNDKKITELKKYSEVIFLQTPSTKQFSIIIDKIYKKYNKKIDDETKIEIYKQCRGDIRQLILLLEGLYCFSNELFITIDIYNEFKKCNNQKEESIELNDITNKIMTQKMNYEQIEYYFDLDCMLLPMMLYHNSLNYIKGCEDTFKKKVKTYKNIMKSLCVHDTIQTNIFEFQEWDNLYDLSIFYGSVQPNYYFLELTNKKKISIEFTLLLNKVSQMYMNKKMLGIAKESLYKLYFDTNQIIYLAEILLYYFNDFKNNIDDCKDNDKNEEESDDNNEDSDEEEDKKKKEENRIGIKNKNYIDNNSKLIQIMNYYHITLCDLENIFKVEKLNRELDKKTKKFTTKIKKKIELFLIF